MGAAGERDLPPMAQEEARPLPLAPRRSTLVDLHQRWVRGVASPACVQLPAYTLTREHSRTNLFASPPARPAPSFETLLAQHHSFDQVELVVRGRRRRSAREISQRAGGATERRAQPPRNGAPSSPANPAGGRGDGTALLFGAESRLVERRTGSASRSSPSVSRPPDESFAGRAIRRRSCGRRAAWSQEERLRSRHRVHRDRAWWEAASAFATPNTSPALVLVARSTLTRVNKGPTVLHA